MHVGNFFRRRYRVRIFPGIGAKAGFDVLLRAQPAIVADRADLSPAKRAARELPDDGEHELATRYAV